MAMATDSRLQTKAKLTAVSKERLPYLSWLEDDLRLFDAEKIQHCSLITAQNEYSGDKTKQMYVSAGWENDEDQLN